MEDWLSIVLTAAFTLLGGVILLIVSKAFEVLVITPLQGFKQQSQIVLDRVDFYSNRLTNFFSDDPDAEEIKLRRRISEEIRSAATLLKAKYSTVSAKPILVWLWIIPSREEFDATFGSLILLSNNLPVPARERHRTPEQSQIDVNNRAIEQIVSILGR